MVSSIRLDLWAESPAGEAHGPWVLDPLPLDVKNHASGYDPIMPADVKAARRCVAAVLDLHPAQLTPRLINTYLQIKTDQLL